MLAVWQVPMLWFEIHNLRSGGGTINVPNPEMSIPLKCLDKYLDGDGQTSWRNAVGNLHGQGNRGVVSEQVSWHYGSSSSSTPCSFASSFRFWSVISIISFISWSL